MGFREEFWRVISEIQIERNLSIDEKKAKISQIENILKSGLPKRVFKYRSCNTRNIDALARNVLYAVPGSYMNDPFDCLVYVDREFIVESIKYGFSRKLLDDIRKTKSLPESLIKYLPQNYAQEFLEGCLKLTEEEIVEKEQENSKNLQTVIDNVNGFIDLCIRDLQDRSLITSFAGSPFDSSMWSRYAGENKGFVLEYAVEDTRFDFCRVCSNKQTGTCDGSIVAAYWYPIVYQEERFDATTWVDYKIADAALFSSSMRRDGYQPDVLIFDKCCLVKGKKWELEDEWRLVCYPQFSLPESKPIAIHTPIPCAIYYGSKIAEEDFRLLHKIIEDFRTNGATIKEYRMYVDPYSCDFDMKCKEIQ